jgi:hypothetical protein
MTLDTSLLLKIIAVSFLAGGAYWKLWRMGRDVNRLGRKHNDFKEQEYKQFLLVVAALVDITPHEERMVIVELLKERAK